MKFSSLLRELILENTPEGPVYYPKDQLTDKPERFFVSEIIREKILQQYKKEVPYSCEVIVDSFKEDTTNKGDAITRIEAHIYVNRKSLTMNGKILLILISLFYVYQFYRFPAIIGFRKIS